MTIEIKKSCCFQCWHWCDVDVHIEDGKIVKILPDKSQDPNKHLCVKSASIIDFHDHPNRKRGQA